MAPTDPLVSICGVYVNFFGVQESDLMLPAADFETFFNLHLHRHSDKVVVQVGSEGTLEDT